MKHAFFWKLMERFGVQGTRFLVQIILARILVPEHYGMLSILVVFTNLADVLIQSSFYPALVQNKDVTDEDHSSVFWVCLAFSGVLYVLIFLTAPMILAFFGMSPALWPLRVLALVLFPGALNSVQLAKACREMDFYTVFRSNVAGNLISGVISIGIALAGGGLWALVAQMLLNVTVTAVVMLFTVHWRPAFVYRRQRVAVLLRYGWKLLAASTLDILYQDLLSVVIGKGYGATALGYFNRGKQFPHFVTNAANGTVQSVMLPALSSEQDRLHRVKQTLRDSSNLIAYITLPIMAGLVAVAPNLIRLLLTEKWLPCVPYLRIMGLSLIFHPVHTCNMQAINAIGRSDIALKLEALRTAAGIGFLAAAMVFFPSPLAIAGTYLAACAFGWLLNACFTARLLGYRFREQARDVLPSVALTCAMGLAVMAADLPGLPTPAALTLQVLLGVVTYVILSILFRMAPFRTLLTLAKETFAPK